MNPTVQLLKISIACALMAVVASCVNQEDRLSKIDTSYPIAPSKLSDSAMRSLATEDVVSEIAAYSSVDAEFTGIGGVKSEQYKRLEWLSRYPTDKELIALTNHPSSNVKAYAFWALVNRKSPAVKPVLEAHLYDSSSFTYLSGCMGSPKYINLSFLDRASPFLSTAEKDRYIKKIKSFYGKEQWESIEKWEKFL